MYSLRSVFMQSFLDFESRIMYVMYAAQQVRECHCRRAKENEISLGFGRWGLSRILVQGDIYLESEQH